MSLNPLSPLRLTFFALPAMTFSIMSGPATGILPALYAKELGVDLTTIGMVLLIARMFDAVTDPLIGFFSDRTRTPIGRRKPWVIGGTAMSVIGISFLFNPPAGADAYYFLLWSLVMYLAWTLLLIPHTAWATELSGNYHERSRIASYRAAAGNIGSFIFMVMPLLPIFPTMICRLA